MNSKQPGGRLRPIWDLPPDEVHGHMSLPWITPRIVEAKVHLEQESAKLVERNGDELDQSSVEHLRSRRCTSKRAQDLFRLGEGLW